ncbi:MAG: 5' nucleotidase, NT5C type [Candidatus Hodarchaeales archaeon]
MEINELWKNQKEFNEKVIGKRLKDLSQSEKQYWTKELVLCLISECNELLREIAWKVHRKEDIRIIPSNLLEEWIDIFKYWLSIGLIWQFNAKQLWEEYWRKSAVVEQRWTQEQMLNRFDKIVAIDIDGVLYDYPKEFFKFIQDKTGIRIEREIKNYDLYVELSKEFSIPVLSRLKDEYRQSGYLKKGLPIDGSREFLKSLKQMGFGIALMTAREYKKYKRIYGDTLEWLRNNDMIFDGIVWSERKEEAVYRSFPNLAFAVEDNLDNANKIAMLGIQVFLLDKTYNKGKTDNKVIRVNNLNDIIRRLK